MKFRNGQCLLGVDGSKVHLPNEEEIVAEFGGTAKNQLNAIALSPRHEVKEWWVRRPQVNNPRPRGYEYPRYVETPGEPGCGSSDQASFKGRHRRSPAIDRRVGAV